MSLRTVESPTRILLVDDDADFAAGIERALRADGLSISRFATLADARRADLGGVAAVLLDIGLPDGQGTVLLEEWHAARPELPIVMITGAPSLDSAIKSLRGRAFDYLRKPFSHDVLRATVERALEMSRLRRENMRLREELGQAGRGGLIGDAACMRQLREKIAALAAAPTTVLIQGETGTGKELAAQALHDGSGRTGRFVPVNCAALPETLLEAELFGHRKGAFTGAVADREGLLAEAEGGTLFLDEVGEMPPSIQVKVLRLLQNFEYRPLGESRGRTADVRVVAATNRDLAREMGKGGKFREDLYWRLAVVTLEVPPLRERREDIDALAAHFISRHAARLGKAVSGIEPDALVKLERHAWPGNVRELENVIERAVLLGRSSRISASEIDLPAAAERPDDPSLTGDVLAFERAQLVTLLKKHKGNVAAAAKAAGRNRTAFYAILKKHGIGAAEIKAMGKLF